jgi:hypothetical protein
VIETSGEGLCCGYDSGLPVTDDYRAPFRFTGRISRSSWTSTGMALRRPTATRRCARR